MKNLRILMIVTSAHQMTNGEATGLWLEEFAIPYLVFKQAHAEITVASPKGGEAPIDPRSIPNPAQQKDWQEASEKLHDTLSLEHINSADFDAVFLPGGHGTMFDLPNNPALAALLQKFSAENKVIAAVCHGPAAFIGVNDVEGKPLVSGKKITSFTNSEERAVKLDKAMPFLLESRLREIGADFISKENFAGHVIHDGKLVTGQNPASSQPAADMVLKLLK
jgi:putative intracellular protease/amidase